MKIGVFDQRAIVPAIERSAERVAREQNPGIDESLYGMYGSITKWSSELDQNRLKIINYIRSTIIPNLCKKMDVDIVFTRESVLYLDDENALDLNDEIEAELSKDEWGN